MENILTSYNEELSIAIPCCCGCGFIYFEYKSGNIYMETYFSNFNALQHSLKYNIESFSKAIRKSFNHKNHLVSEIVISNANLKKLVEELKVMNSIIKLRDETEDNNITLDCKIKLELDDYNSSILIFTKSSKLTDYFSRYKSAGTYLTHKQFDNLIKYFENKIRIIEKGGYIV